MMRWLTLLSAFIAVGMLTVQAVALLYLARTEYSGTIFNIVVCPAGGGSHCVAVA